MTRLPFILRSWRAILLPCVAASAQAGNLDTIGVTALRAAHPELTGSGETVAQVEAIAGAGRWQVSPASVSQPGSLFRYYNSGSPYGGAGAAFNASTESGHANDVGRNYYGLTTGAAPGVTRVENFEANYFWTKIVRNLVVNGSVTTWNPVPIAAPIVNQSFVFDTTDPVAIAQVSTFYDHYANLYGTLFVNGANNGAGSVTHAPGSMYNGITVGRMDGAHTGRVHLVAPGGATSYATPFVSGSAALLRQAAGLGHFGAGGGVDPADARLLKAGLINGATKTAGWSQTETDPLDATYGAGVVNVEHAHRMLSGGQHARSAQTFVALGTTPVTTPVSNLLSFAEGWDLATLTATLATDAVSHYFFDLSSSSSVTFTATLTWNSLANVSTGTNLISNFDLVLVDTLTNSIVWSSRSTGENVEHIHLTGLAGGVYELQVILRGGAGAPILTDEYALVWSWDGIAAVPEPGAGVAVALVGFAVLVAVRRRTAGR